MKKYLTIIALIMAFTLLLGAVGALGSAGVGVETPGTGAETPGTDTETPGTGTLTPGSGTQAPDYINGWVFKDVTFFAEDGERYDLPALEEGVLYTFFVDGEEVRTVTYESGACNFVETSDGKAIIYCDSGDLGFYWNFVSLRGEHESCVVSVSIGYRSVVGNDWLFKDETFLAGERRYDLPALEPGVYTVYMNGKYVRTITCLSTHDTVRVEDSNFDHIVYYYEGGGKGSWVFGSEIGTESCVVSVRCGDWWGDGDIETPDDTENWLFQDVEMFDYEMYGIPALEAGVTYTVFVNGEEIQTLTYEENTCGWIELSDCDTINYCNGGNDGFYWQFMCVSLEHSSCVVSVRIDG